MTYSFERTNELCERRAPRKKLETNLIPNYLKRKALEMLAKGQLIEF